MKGKIQIELEYDFDVQTEEEVIEALENVELPDNYVENSFEILKINNKPFD